MQLSEASKSPVWKLLPFASAWLPLLPFVPELLAAVQWPVQQLATQSLAALRCQPFVSLLPRTPLQLL